MEVSKSGGVGGSWIDKKALKSGDLLKITTEASWVDSQQGGKQLVAKCRVKGHEGEFNFAINSPSKNALIDAFGSDTANWIGKVLTVAVETGIFAGRRGVMLNLVPEGFEIKEDSSGYIVIAKKGAPVAAPTEYPEVDINPDDIPF